MIELRVTALEMPEGSPLVRVTLQDTKSERKLWIWVGIHEAVAISQHLEGTTLPRPMTHDLFMSTLTALNARVERLTISDMRDETYFGVLSIILGDKECEVDCRPSDGIAIAIRADAPISISEALLSRIEQAEQERAEQTPDLVPGAIVVEGEDTTIH